MAIEIIPKKQQTLNSFKEKIYYFSVGFFIIVILLIFAFIFFKCRFSKGIIDIENFIEEQKTEEILTLEKRLQGYNTKVANVPSVINNRKSLIFFLDHLEKLTHPLVYFTNIELDVDSGIISGSGFAKNMVAFDQQLNIFKKSNAVFASDDSKFTIQEDKTVEFSVTVTIR